MYADLVKNSPDAVSFHESPSCSPMLIGIGIARISGMASAGIQTCNNSLSQVRLTDMKSEAVHAFERSALFG